MSEIILIGTGQMAIAYVKVLESMKISFVVVGRGHQSAKEFQEETGYCPVTGGLERYLSKNKVGNGTAAIVATGTENLMVCMLQLLSAGVEKILVEKPAALSIEELLDNEKLLRSYKNSVFVAYNRRFYASVIETERLIIEDGGLQSMHFEFTEWAHEIGPMQKAKGVKENWFFGNSTHVIDLAFFIAGNPKELKSFSKSGKLDWHDKTNFAGAGRTEKGVLFSYLSNWESAGRWGIELLTKKRRFYLKPLESIHVQEKGCIHINKHDCDLSLDQKYKPGLYLQVEEFLRGHKNRAVSIEEHIDNSRNIFSELL